MSDGMCCACRYDGDEETSCPERDDNQHCRCWYEGEPKQTPGALSREQVVKMLVDKFLAWPLPDSVCSDLCATKRGYPHRSGTSLLTADEAKQMLEYLLGEMPDAAQRATIEQQAQEMARLKSGIRDYLRPLLKIIHELKPQLIGCSREQELTYKKAVKDVRQFFE